MLGRLLLVFVLLLQPLQWSAAQQHELADDRNVLAALLSPDGPGIAQLAHADEPGGVCQFHEFAQATVLPAAAPSEAFPARARGGWRRAGRDGPGGSDIAHRIDRPKWDSRPSPGGETLAS